MSDRVLARGSNKNASRLPQFAVGGILITVVLVAIFISRSRDTFPSLPPGRYQGQATLLGSTDAPVSIFVERREVGNKLLFVAFSEGWKPQAVTLLPVDPDEAKESFDGPFEGIAVRDKGQTFTLHGTASGSGYSGYVVSNDNRRGAWTLNQIADDEFLLDEKTLGSSSADLGGWLELKARYRVMNQQLTKLSEMQTDKTQKFEKLTQFVSEENLLKSRAESRKQVLLQDVEKAKAEREEVKAAMNTLVEDLNVQRRVSSKGRAVELARRVANRENKWYLANWRVEEDRQGIEEYVGESIQIDFRKLDAAFTRATEIQALQREVAAERQKIRELETRGSAPPQPAAQPSDPLVPLDMGPTKKPPAPDDAEPSFWDKVF